MPPPQTFHGPMKAAWLRRTLPDYASQLLVEQDAAVGAEGAALGNPRFHLAEALEVAQMIFMAKNCRLFRRALSWTYMKSQNDTGGTQEGLFKTRLLPIRRPMRPTPPLTMTGSRLPSSDVTTITKRTIAA